MSTAAAPKLWREPKAKPIEYGPAGSIVYLTLRPDLDEHLRKLGFKALPRWSDIKEFKRALRRRLGYVLHQGSVEYGQALELADNALAKYDADFAFTVDISEIFGFDQAGDQFLDFFNETAGKQDGQFGDSIEFEQLIAKHAKRVIRPPVDTGDRLSANGHVATASANHETDADVDNCKVTDRWPKIRPEAFHGLAGDIVRLCDPETEADPVAVLLQVLTGFGNMVGRRPHFVVNATRHYLNLFVALVGLTATGRKGTSWDVARYPLAAVDQDWADNRVLGGLVSGEGLIFHVRDPIVEQKSVKDPDTKQMKKVMVEVDAGVPDKRLQVIETEMGRVLKAMNRDSSTLSEVIRQCWDSGNLRTLNRKDPVKAIGAHVSIVGHITPADVQRHLDETDSANGFANRFLWVCARRSKLLPEGGDVFAIEWPPIQQRLADALVFARDTTGADWTVSDSGGCGRRMRRDPAASKAWNAIYEELSAGKPGLLGKVLSRAEAQVMRLACLYALLDCSGEVKPEHLVAALAVWDYCSDSARLVFGEGMGDPDSEKLLGALKDADEGLTRTQITVDVFGRHKKAAEIAGLLGDLLTQGLIHRVNQPNGKGRPTERWFHGKDEAAN
jgi:Protein of unknown function (DUF3987)